ncbi:protein translocase subunit SecD [Coxiella burnetii]|uniref:Protein translocase subunit SecD n=1 Tax=Coxiella burnetii (strain RSA 493 / Nine Mile phase I) TaxID=227377 RepID=Q83CH3_COXBU|nr:protein translocase subunit SecD [Coxiella burnetii]NP_820141.1 protein translocase subunit SecD [Coxiella burnetii RSA 493]AAO90655.1 protein translocase subunit [Coxiella burnetii RSA 493]ARI65949.1 protein translocase subunit SecD [Coxiella burnetii]ARK27415.1 protein-export membrane protein SecD [Coxiella burnetii]MCF2093628.1 protein translocase subunit SecD [Coxiella burnetii]MCF2095716.1 protein translocase subunit SecD [Coxiella burnetii]
MNRYPLWRYILLAVLIIISLIYALPNLYGEDPAIQISAKNSAPIEAVEEKIKSTLNAQHISYLSVRPVDNTVLVRFPSTEDQLKAQDVIQAVVGTDYSVALNLAPRTPRWLQAIGAKPMRLGLDLRGGIHFLLDVDVGAMVKAQETGDLHTMSTALREARIRYTEMSSDQNGVMIHFRDQAARDQARTLLEKQFPDYRFEATASSLRGTISITALHQIQQNAVDQITTILRNRVNELGVAEPVIQQQGESQISVDLPGIQDTARAKDIIGKVATIRLQLVDVEHDAETASSTGTVPFGSKLYTFEKQLVLLKQQVVLKGTSIINASSVIGEDGRPAVRVRVSGSDVPSFNRITGENVGKPLAVVYVETQTTRHLVDGKVVTQHRQIERIINIATIQTALGNDFQITNLSTMDYAKNLALLLRSGAYPVPVDFVQERVVGPSLGQENIHMGVLSTEIGALLVIVFMAFYYRLFGVIADIALALNIVFIVAVLSILGATLTLPGIAGIVLTVGMAVDANVLINERIREELRNGMSPQASIKAGYDRAFATIVDANVTTLIVMIILFALGSGPVQGFAVTTTIGLLSSMVTAIFFTRAVVNLVYGRRRASRLSIGINAKSAEAKK